MSSISVLCLFAALSYAIQCHSANSDIAVYNSDNIDSFVFNTFFSNHKPVVINSDLHDWYSNTQFFDIKTLYQHYGDNTFEYGTSIDLAMTSRHPQDDIPLKLYLRKSKYKQYQIFDPYFIANNADKIGLKSLDLFHTIDTQMLTAYTFLFGKVGSGISFQSHGNMWLHQITGKTKIYFYPPQYSPIGGALDWTAYTSKQWQQYILPYLTQQIPDIERLPQKEIWDSHLERVYHVNITSIADVFDPEEQPFFTPYKPFECVLTEGQLLYVPKLWWYSTLNTKNEHNISIAMMMQTDDIPKQAALARRSYHDALRNFNTGFDYLYRHNNALSAKMYFTKALLLDPTFISSYIALADIYIHSAQKHKEHLDTVIQFLSVAYLLNPEYDVVRESLMGLLKQKGELELVKKLKNKQPL